LTILKRKRFWGLFLTVGLLVYCFYDLDLRAIGVALSGLKFKILIPLLFLEIIITYVRSARMKFFIDPLKQEKVTGIFPIYCVGTMVNWLMPYFTGQVARVYLFSKKFKLKKTFFTTTSVLEAILDGTSLFALVIITSMFVVIPDEFKGWHLIIFGGAIAFVAAILLVISRSHRKSRYFIKRSTIKMSPRVKKKIEDISFSFFSGLETLKSSKHFSVVSLLSVTSWILQAAMVYLLVIAFGYKINIAGAVIITALVNIMMTIVVAPGNIGTFQGATVAAMAPFGVGKSEALAFSFLLHILVYLPPIVLGSLYALKEGLTFKQLKDEGSKGVDSIQLPNENGNNVDAGEADKIIFN